MSDPIIKNTQTSGFYYDIQMSNPLLTATLHTNTYIASVTHIKGGGSEDKDIIKREDFGGKNLYEYPGYFNWELWKQKKDSGEDDEVSGSVHCLDPITYNYSLSEDMNPSGCYRAKPLVTSILSEDFQVEIGNQWSDAGGTNSIESLFNSLKSSAPYTKEIAGGMSKLVDQISGSLKEKGKEDSWLGKASNFASYLANRSKDSANLLNSALIVQGTRFSYYGGTQTNFGNLTMRFTLFADWVYGYDPTSQSTGWYFRTVHDQLQEIYPYAVGKYSSIDPDVIKAWEEATGKSAGDTGKAVGNAVDKTIATFFGWQNPPGGFQSDVRSLDTCQKGTLRLVLGGYYTAENLIISGMSVNFSKTMTKIPPRVKSWITTDTRKAMYDGTYSYEEEYVDENEETQRRTVTRDKTYSGKEGETSREIGDTGEGELTPLYAEVTISLRPASSYSDNTIINFSSNKGSGKFMYADAKMRNSLLQREIQKKESIAKKAQKST